MTVVYCDVTSSYVYTHITWPLDDYVSVGISMFISSNSGLHFAVTKLECWQLTCQFPTCRSPVLCSFDRDNSMYEQQTWMLTLGLLNRNTGCQCCSVRCSSMLKLLCISIHNLDFQNFNFSTVRIVKRVELHNYAKFCWNRSNRGRDMAIFRFLKMGEVAMLDF